MDDLVRIERGVFDRLLADARANPNIECCGLLAGREAVISAILPAKNALQSPKAYEIAPQQLFELFRRIRLSFPSQRGKRPFSARYRARVLSRICLSYYLYASSCISPRSGFSHCRRANPRALSPDYLSLMDFDCCRIMRRRCEPEPNDRRREPNAPRFPTNTFALAHSPGAGVSGARHSP
jgi:hypothetical protein